MNAIGLEKRIQEYLRAHSGLREKRGYVPLSYVGRCPRQAYFSALKGVDDGDFSHRMCYVGYLFKRDALARLVAMGVAMPDSGQEVVCPANPLIRGMTDGVTQIGELLEIKSVSKHKFETVDRHQRGLFEHEEQAQLLMRYGFFSEALLIYVCRDTFEQRVFSLAYNADLADTLEQKLLYLASCVENQAPPACECGKCPSTAPFAGERSGLRSGGLG